MSKSKRSKMQPSINLGEDIFTEILLRSPVKSVLKFQTVSKLWLSIVSTRRFRQTHASRHRASATALYFKSFETYSYKVLPLNINNIDTMKIPYKLISHLSRPQWCRSSCNGLQLLQSYDKTYYVHNPTTKEYKALDLPQRITNNIILNVCASLAFDPSESLHYKVVFLSNFDLEVYSSATGQCTSPVNNALFGDYNYSESSGIYCYGAIHWLRKDSTSIIYFNVHTECINQLRTPLSHGYVRYFGESQGHLHLVKSDAEKFNLCSFLYVYELKKDYSGWFMKYKVELAFIKSALPSAQASDIYGTSLSIVRDKEEDNSVLLVWIWDEWVEYNFKQKTTKRLCRYVQTWEHDSPSPWTYWFNTYQFIPTLTCI